MPLAAKFPSYRISCDTGRKFVTSQFDAKKLPPTRMPMGFEPTRAEHNGLAVHRLNHSATSSGWWTLFLQLWRGILVGYSETLDYQMVSTYIKGSVDRSPHERHFWSLLPYFLLSWLQIFQLCLSFWASSIDLVIFLKFLQEKEKYPKNHPKRLSS